MVPHFILKQIAATNPANAFKEKGLLLKEHTLVFDPIKKELSDFITNPTPVAPRFYSTRDDLYTSSIFPHDYFLECMFSIIEGDAARLIRSKVAQAYSPEANFLEVNPFYFPLSAEEKPNQVNKIRARVILSLFFTIQFLRSQPRQFALEAYSVKRGLSSRDFADNIMDFLVNGAMMQTYSRQWTWIRVPYHEMFVSELGLVTLPTCSEKNASLMPISRNDFIFFHEFTDTHFCLNDKVIYSTSSIIYDWYFKSQFEQIWNLELRENESKHAKLSFVSNRAANFTLNNIAQPEGDCFGCVLEPVRNDPKDIVFYAEDVSPNSSPFTTFFS